MHLPKETYKLILEKGNDAIDTFYVNYGKYLLNHAVKNWKIDQDEAWEIIYETFYTITDKINNLDFASEEKFKSFVTVVFLNKIRNHLRKHKIQTETFDNENIAGYQGDENEELKSLDLEILKSELENLEDWERMLLLMRAQQMPYSEIAKFVNKPEEQLKVYFQRLKKKLSDRILSRKEAQNAIK